MLALTKAKSPTKVTGRANLFDSLDSRSITKGNTLSKKRIRSPGDTSDTTTGMGTIQSKVARSVASGSLQLRTAFESPWQKHETIYSVELGGTVEVALRKASPVKLVHV